MTFDLSAFLLLGLLSTSLHWLIARSTIAKPLWSRAGALNALLRCPACSGFWLGLGLGAIGFRPAAGLHPAVEIATSGLLALFTTPVLEGVLLWGLYASSMDDT